LQDVAAATAVAVAALPADQRAEHIKQPQQQGSAGLVGSSSGCTSAMPALIDWDWKVSITI
jgi:hypothetical protein